ncbi:MAG: hypothetical protein KME25_26220 [Symplocastrum torsivum CPER-KK1]|jgi:hypothetical protein|uniref:Uncharacterized protein n=1 Tax=Symplocastrum torsivum CPER-KK1 TaxID=450513 RepID=A0A951PPZ3_9CYAN|nr:hypothetical protein [Symplocastrum torsivum CPER-KK1]
MPTGSRRAVGPRTSNPIPIKPVIAFTTLFSSFASLAYGRVKTRLDFISILTLIFRPMGVSYVIIDRVQSYEQILIGLAVSGLGLGLLMPNGT